MVRICANRMADGRVSKLTEDLPMIGVKFELAGEIYCTKGILLIKIRNYLYFSYTFGFKPSQS